MAVPFSTMRLMWAGLVALGALGCGEEGPVFGDPTGPGVGGTGGGDAGAGGELGGGGAGGVAGGGGSGGVPQGGGGDGGATLCPVPDCPTAPSSWNCDPACGAVSPECSTAVCTDVVAAAVSLPSGVSQLRLGPVVDQHPSCAAISDPSCDDVWWTWRFALPQASAYCLHVRGPESARYYLSSFATPGMATFICEDDGPIICGDFTGGGQNYDYLNVVLLDPAVSLASAPADGGALFTFELAAQGCETGCGTDCGGSL